MQLIITNVEVKNQYKNKQTFEFNSNITVNLNTLHNVYYKMKITTERKNQISSVSCMVTMNNCTLENWKLLLKITIQN